MKIKIKTYNGELPSYLTVGKVYEVAYLFDDIENLPCIRADNDAQIVCSRDIGCGHLNGGSWEVVE